MSLRARQATLLSAGLLATAACTAILGLDDKTLEASGITEDGGRDASTGGDAAKPHVDAAANCTPDDAGYHDPSVAACWEKYEVPVAFDDSPEYAGAAFDGRYVYFVSAEDGLVVRYDTQASFEASNSWSEFDTTNLQGGNEEAYQGIVFDGRYMYFIPDGGDAIFIRYDTQGGFDANGSWTTYTVPSNAIGYQGGTFDGRYVYFAPGEDDGDDDAGGDGSGLVLRYDTQGGFTSSASWSSFDTTKADGSLASEAAGYRGAVFDGRYVYLVPVDLTANVAARYDTKGAFDEAASWELFDTMTLNSQIQGYASAMFDGAFVYLIPQYASEVVLQFDITKPFTAATSWQQYNVASGSGTIGGNDTPTFAAGGYDGRFLYYVPGITVGDQLNGLLGRNDDGKKEFLDAGAWSTFDTTKIHADSFGATVYDGRYLYLAPGGGTPTFARFDTKETSSQPKLPGYFGSFF